MIWVMAASILFGMNATVIAASVAGGVDSVSQAFYTSSVNLVVNLLPLSTGRRTVNRKIKKSQIGLLLLCGLLGMGMTGSLLAASYQLIGTGTSTVVHFMYPAVVSASSWLFLKKRLKVKTLVSIVFSVCGVLMIVQVTEGAENGRDFIPAALSSVTYGVYLLLNDYPRLREIPLPVKCFWMCVGSSTGLGLYLLHRGWMTGPSGLRGVLLIGAAGCIAAGAYRCLVYGIGRVGAVSAAFATLLEPLTSMLMGILFGQELMTGRKGLGCILILISVLLNGLT